MRTQLQIIGAQIFVVALVLIGCEGGEEGESTESATTLDAADDDSDSASSGEATTQAESELEAGSLECEHVDEWEPNSAEKPSIVQWNSVDEWTASAKLEDAYLCSDESDWYRFDVESLGYEMHYLYVRALIEEAGLCGADCDEPVLPAGPEYAMTIEIHRADDMELLSSHTQDDGVIAINGPGGEAYAHDLVIHVFSPTKAEYRYRLSVEIRNYDGEDECEC